MTAVSRVDEDMLQAYIDGRLGPDEARVVEDYLAADPAETARTARYIEQRRALRAALQAKFDEPVPARLTMAGIRAAQRRRESRRIGLVAAMLTIAIVAGFAGWVAGPQRSGTGGDPLVADAESARAGTTTPEHAADPDTLAAPDARDRLVADTLRTPAKVPDLSRAGFALAGITVLKDHEGGPALQIAYRDGAGRVFTLYLDRSKGSDRFDLMQNGTMRICVWQNDNLSVVMLGEMPAKEMLKVATMTYGDLDF